MSEDQRPTADVVAELVEFVTVRPAGGRWVGRTPDWFDGPMFGGFILGQATHAATRTAPDGSRLHSLHAYFLRPVLEGPDVYYDLSPIRDGRSFASRRLDAHQDDRLVFTMMCSFTADTDGPEYGRVLGPDIPPPTALPTEVPPHPTPFDVRAVGPTDADEDGVMDSTHRIWVRVAEALPDDDPGLHDALVAYMTDMTWTGSRPLDMDGDETGLISLDHAVWFHRRARADEFLHFDLNALVNTGGRSTIRGVLHGADGRLRASMAQELVLRDS